MPQFNEDVYLKKIKKVTNYGVTSPPSLPYYDSVKKRTQNSEPFIILTYNLLSTIKSQPSLVPALTPPGPWWVGHRHTYAHALPSHGLTRGRVEDRRPSDCQTDGQTV